MIKGAMTALVTPFKSGKVDANSYERIIKDQITNGIDVVVPVGTTGESATLSHSEHKECIEIAISTCKGSSTKVIAGAGSNNTIESIDLAKFAKNAGADGVLSVTPYYNKPTQLGLYEHYKAIASVSEIPVMLYNVPSRTSVTLEIETTLKLFNEMNNIFGIKEASGVIENVVALRSKNSDITIISGDDAINYPIMASGGDGCISVTSNLVPKKTADLIHLASKGEFQASKEINEELYELNEVLFIESNPIPIKFAMYLAGKIDSLEYRLPLTKPSSETVKKIEKVLKKFI
jgi:4-hydroxy-tetrahydrodipicolinate synthase